MNHFHSLNNNANTKNVVKEARNLGSLNGAASQDRIDIAMKYHVGRKIGQGTFGSVAFARVVETGEMVAIKTVLLDKSIINRELQVMRQLANKPHPYIVILKDDYLNKNSNDDVQLSLVLELFPETIYSIAQYYNSRNEQFPIFAVKLYMYQLSRAVAHIHGMGISHRDIKPDNLLVDPQRKLLKLCDFGCAKALVRGQPNVANMCSLYYRAPELLLGATDYDFSIDVWSQGCVFGELLIGSPLFPGQDQLFKINQLLGTPTKSELKLMNPMHQESELLQCETHTWSSVLKPTTPRDAANLIVKMLAYFPEQRLKSIEICAHHFFDELRMATLLTKHGLLKQPQLFLFTREELSTSRNILQLLIPQHLKISSTNNANSSVVANTSTSSSNNHNYNTNNGSNNNINNSNSNNNNNNNNNNNSDNNNNNNKIINGNNNNNNNNKNNDNNGNISNVNNKT